MSCHFSLTCWMWRGVKIEELKDEGAIFFILNLSLLTMPWSTSSHKPFTRLLPVNGRDVLLRRRRSSWDPVLSWLDELFTDWWYSAEQWTAAGSWKAMSSLSQESAMGSVSNKCIVAVIKSWWTDVLSLTAHVPHRLHNPHLLKSIHSCSSLASKGLTFKRGLFVTRLSIKLCSLITLFCNHVLILFWC